MKLFNMLFNIIFNCGIDFNVTNFLTESDDADGGGGGGDDDDHEI
jgi:hypothetical protein